MNPYELAYIARKKLYAFPKLVSLNKIPAHIKLIADNIQGFVENKNEKRKLLIISTPPRHGKSELVSVHTPAWILGSYPKKRLILASYGADLSIGFSDRARNIFAKWGPLLWNVKPSKTQFNKQAWDTDLGGGVISAGVAGPITGKGADVFIIDDYIKDQLEAESVIQRNNIWNWWQSVAASRLHPAATVIIIATRWNADDLIGRLLSQREEKGDSFPWIFKSVNMPAIANKDNDILERKKGQALWPWRYSEKLLEDIKETSGPYVWASLWQGNPVQRSGNLFKAKWFRYFTFDLKSKSYICFRDNKEAVYVKKSELVIHTYVDPALEIKEINDPTGMAAWGYCSKHKIWLLLDVRIDRIDHNKILFEILKFAFKNNSSIIGIENEKIGKIIAKQSQGNDYIHGKTIPFREIKKGRIDKFAYATPMASYFENERIFLLKDAHWLPRYETELLNFPRGKHDECVDITSMATEMGHKLTVAEALRDK